MADRAGNGKGRTVLMLLSLTAFIALAYWRVIGNGFVAYDDDLYVTGNHWIQSGLTWPSFIWAFSGFHASNWHPLTWLSHMTDVELFGLNPLGHHIVSVILHAFNTVLLFQVLKSMTGSIPAGYIAAALFGLHPLRVESVAWIAERKDVLAALFWMLSLAAYLCYLRRPGKLRYLLLIGLFTAGLLAKSTVITLPLILILLDWWPLGRISLPAGDCWRHASRNICRRLTEKVPLLIIAMGFGAVAVLAQLHGESLASLEQVPAAVRIQGAAAAYLAYIWKMLWPWRLAVFYPLKYHRFHNGHAVAMAAVLALATFILARLGRRRPWLIAGWCWYLIVLMPMAGLVTVGAQAMADRYTYLPAIGIFMMAARGAAGWASKSRLKAKIATAAAAFVMAALATGTSIQVGYWHDTDTLFKRALDVVPENWMAYNMLGQSAMRKNQPREATEYFKRSVEIYPSLAELHGNLANAYGSGGNYVMALKHFREALRLKPQSPIVHYNLGLTLLNQGNRGEAVWHLRQALVLRPDFPAAREALSRAAAMGNQHLSPPKRKLK